MIRVCLTAAFTALLAVAMVSAAAGGMRPRIPRQINDVRASGAKSACTIRAYSMEKLNSCGPIPPRPLRKCFGLIHSLSSEGRLRS